MSENNGPPKPSTKLHSHDGGPLHSHAHSGDHSHLPGAAPQSPKLYRGFPARKFGAGGARMFHGMVVDVPAGMAGVLGRLRQAFSEPYVGVTVDGKLQEDLFSLKRTGVSTAPVVDAAKRYLASLRRLDYQQLACEPLDSPTRRYWNNAFPDWVPKGLYLADLEADEREAALAVIEVSLSARGFKQIRDAMKINQALGEFINRSQDTIGENNYFFTIFGEPSEEAPWGWRLTGYHLTMYATFIGDQMVITPTFIGAEMATIDEGPYAGISLLQEEQQAGLELATSLNAEQRKKAVLYPSMTDLPAALKGFDGRHQGVAGRDNLVLPFEGISATALTKGQREQLLHLIGLYVGRASDERMAHWIAQIRAQLDNTYFAWIGDPEKLPFYYRVHSPVILIEFDHHSGVFLSNPDPEPFHIHTIVRTPNGNDYGQDLLRQHYALFDHDRPAGSAD